MTFIEIKKTLEGFVKNRRIAYQSVKVNKYDDTIKHLLYWLAGVKNMNALKTIAINHRQKFEILFSRKNEKQKEKIINLLNELSNN